MQLRNLNLFHEKINTDTVINVKQKIGRASKSMILKKQEAMR